MFQNDFVLKHCYNSSNSMKQGPFYEAGGQKITWLLRKPNIHLAYSYETATRLYPETSELSPQRHILFL
jgi:hypothetical protein